MSITDKLNRLKQACSSYSTYEELYDICLELRGLIDLEEYPEESRQASILLDELKPEWNSPGFHSWQIGEL